MISTVRSLACRCRRINANLSQHAQNVYVLVETIEVHDQQRGPVDAAGLNGADRLGAIDALAAFHLGELVDELTSAIGEEASDHLTLHDEPKAERALTGSARVIVGDEGAGWSCRVTS